MRANSLARRSNNVEAGCSRRALTNVLLGRRGGWGSKDTKVGKAVALAKVSKAEPAPSVAKAGGGGKNKPSLVTRKEAPKFFALR